MKLAGKKALITGGNSGIGLATARLFIAEGAQVAITGRDQKTINDAIAELGPSARGHRADEHHLEWIGAQLSGPGRRGRICGC